MDLSKCEKIPKENHLVSKISFTEVPALFRAIGCLGSYCMLEKTARCISKTAGKEKENQIRHFSVKKLECSFF